MCGIVSILSPSAPVDEAALRRATDALHHRGPDGRGVWIAPDRRVGLGHTRLSVIDLETGAQPLANEDGQVMAVVNGEFYDFERLRRELEARGHHFRTRSDSEVLLHLYEEHGAGCLHHLRGEFAFILWDGRDRTLLAGRDRFGIKPLCYAVVGEALYLASEAKALFAAGVPAAWDRAAFFHAASLQYVPPDRTLFAGVYQLPPGHYLLADSARVRTHRYWDLDYAPPEEWLPEHAVEEHVRAFGERLDEAVRLRLRADVPVACHLSGGLDSSAVLGLALRHSTRPVECFTVSFTEEPYDELPIAEETAARAGVPLHPVRVAQADLLDALPDAVYFSEGLAINGHLAAKFLLSRAVRRAGFKVVLTGEGADEVVAGYPHLRQDLLHAEASAGADVREKTARLRAANDVSAGIMLSEGGTLPLDAVERALGFVPDFLRAKAAFGRRTFDLLNEDFKAEFAGRDCCRVLLNGIDVRGQLAGRHRVDQSLYLWTKLALANYILRTLGDGAEMAHAVEGRLPFLDHHLFEFVRRLPVSMKIRGAVEKYVLREAVRPVIPDAVYRRQKHPFLAPPVSRFGGARLDGLLRDALDGTAGASVPFYDRAKVLRLLDDLPRLDERERAAADPVLMTVLTACLLHRRFNL